MSNQSYDAKPHRFIQMAWRHRQLIWRLALREIQSRYAGSLIGSFWPLLTSLVMLAIYTFIFGVVFPARWEVKGEAGTLQFALILFVGLTTFNFFSECVVRAPGLVLENVVYVKKVVFPLEILPCIALLHAGFNALMALVILACAFIIINGLPGVSIITLPLVLLPLIFLSLGLSWALAALGVFLRDLRQIIGLLTTGLLFLTPIFYPLSAIPIEYRPILEMSPLAFAVNNARDVIIFGLWPDWTQLGIHLGLSFFIAWIGFFGFTRAKKGFADVL